MCNNETVSINTFLQSEFSIYKYIIIYFISPRLFWQSFYLDMRYTMSNILSISYKFKSNDIVFGRETLYNICQFS